MKKLILILLFYTCVISCKKDNDSEYITFKVTSPVRMNTYTVIVANNSPITSPAGYTSGGTPIVDPKYFYEGHFDASKGSTVKINFSPGFSSSRSQTYMEIQGNTITPSFEDGEYKWLITVN